MKKGDPIIWDSHFGYDLGYYEGESNIFGSKCLIKNETGKVQGLMSVRESEVYPYSKGKLLEMANVYGYEKRLPELNNSEMTDLKIEYYNQAHLMDLEGTASKKPSKKLIIDHARKRGYKVSNIEVWWDRMIRYWQISGDIEVITELDK